MNPHGQQARAFDGDPPTFEDYHQDYLDGRKSAVGGEGLYFVLILGVISVAYHFLRALDYDLPPVPTLVWNILVYLTPSRLLDVVAQDSARISDPARRNIPRTHAEKSEAIRQIIGLDTRGVLDFVANASRRKLSAIPLLNMSRSNTDGGPPGIRNVGSFCYQNSILQGLASLTMMPKYLAAASLKVRVEVNGSQSGIGTAKALKDLLERLNNPAFDGKTLKTPKILEEMGDNQQQDAQEYYGKVIDTVDQEIFEVSKKSRSIKGLEDIWFSKSIAPSPRSAYQNPLYGAIAERLACTKCGYTEGLKVVPFFFLSLTLRNVPRINIEECLDDFTRLDAIDEVHCVKCTLLKTQRQVKKEIKTSKGEELQKAKQRLDAITRTLDDDGLDDDSLVSKCHIKSSEIVKTTKTKQSVLARPPRSFVVHLARSLHDGNYASKNCVKVRFPTILDLAPWSLGNSDSTNKVPEELWTLDAKQSMVTGSGVPSKFKGPLYELRAVIIHEGIHSNGHYICYRKQASPKVEGKTSPEQWWRISDANVSPAAEEAVLTTGDAYMLFYDLIQPSAPEMAAFRKPRSGAWIPSLNTDLATSSDTEVEFPPEDDSPIHARGFTMPSIPDITMAMATMIPLPDMDDEDLFDSDSQDHEFDESVTDASIATETALSDLDEEEVAEKDQNNSPDYHQTKPIYVSPYVRRPGLNDEEEALAEQKIVGLSSSLVMV